jgi:asparagine synthase (glutamine-hydrolysing)
MCGILGVFDASGLRPDAAAFEAGLERLALRGPDDAGVWHDDLVRLGHRRLSVVDLSAAGHQPMFSSDRRYVIVFNGEIYNHQDLRRRLSPRGGWAGSSDTETLLEAFRAWGPACLQHLNGMFAFAIWDKTERTLFLARDRMGVKPLYFSQVGSMFGFASRPGALACAMGASEVDIDPEALRAYLELGYVPAPLSFHKAARKLPPGNYLLANARGVRIVRYWDFRPIAVDQGANLRSEDDLADELAELVRDAVKLRLISDVPLGAFLSGGVDSSLIVASMKAAGVEHPKAFTIAFREKDYDEGPAAARIAADLGVEHIQETLSADSLVDLLPFYIEQYDEPFSDSSAFPTLALARLARRHVTVALSGDGADEIFGGYHYYPLMSRLKRMVRLSASTKHMLAACSRRLPWHRAKLFSGVLGCSDSVELFNYLRSISKDYPSLISDDLAGSTSSSATLFAQFATDFAIDLNAAEKAMRLDAGFTLPEQFLQKVDVATMAFSLEARCPMTDYRLVEWAMRLPAHYKFRGGVNKYLLKKALSRYLPADRIDRPKMGFGVPIAQWLRGPLRGWAEDLLNDRSLMSSVPLQGERVRSLWDTFQLGKRQAHPILWSVLMLLCYVDARRSARPSERPAYRQVA